MSDIRIDTEHPHLCSNGVQLYCDAQTVLAVDRSPFSGATAVFIPRADLERIIRPSWWSRFWRRHIVDDYPYDPETF